MGGAKNYCQTQATLDSRRHPKAKHLKSLASRSREGGKTKHRPFHSYTMKQAIDERFILDVLKSYTPVDSYYKLVKKTEDDPEFDTKKGAEEVAALC